MLTAWHLAVLAAWLVLPFVLAGSIAWPPGWLYLAIVIGAALAEDRFVTRKNPELKRRRKQIGHGTKAWDLAWNFLFWPLMASMAIVAGAQARVAALSWWWWPVGLALAAAGFTLSAWAMGENPYFEGTARIQTEVGHQVFAGGPYRYVRHPGYLGLVLWALGSPFLLLSTSSFVPAVATAVWIAFRTVLEDRMLRRELPGYAEYARRTRARMIPGVW